MPNKWRYYEGTTSANSILKDLAKVLCTAVKDDPILDGNGNVAKPAKVIQDRNWDVVYPAVNKNLVNAYDWNDLTPEEFEAKIISQLSQAGDTVILKTKTTPVTLGEGGGLDDIGLEDDLSVQSIDMYIELYKPKYMADPEKYNPESERLGITPYNITRSIYEEYASTTAVREINLITDDTTKALLTYQVTPYRPNKYTRTWYTEFTPANAETNVNQKMARQLYLDVTGTALPLTMHLDGYSTYNTGDLTVSMDKLQDSTKAMVAAFMEGTSQYEGGIDSFTKITMNFVYSAGYYYTTITLQKDVTKYRIPSTFKFTLPDSQVKATSVVLLINGVNQAGTYNYNMETREFSMIKQVPVSPANSYLDPSQPPIVQYTYDKEQTTITARKLLYNNHYIYIRMFDVPNISMSGPMENDIDPNTGEVMKINSHVSEWAKLGWYQDYEEVMADELDEDVGVADLSQGIVFLPIETPGLNGDTRIRFWVNTNNDRAAIMLMGNPSLDFSANRHLTSMLYLGKIESFENSINDTAGNFAMFTSSSTVPCATKTIKKRVTMPVAFTDADGLFGVGTGSQVTFTKKLAKGKFFDTGVSPSVKFGDGQPLEAGYFTFAVSTDKTSVVLSFAQDIYPNSGVECRVAFSYYEESVSNVNGITRDSFGNILEIKYPETWGKNTATGVTDICMLHTRSKAYFQKHHFMFTTTEEYMTKEMYGKSAYTGEYYADKIKITHGNDGPRGMLQDVLVIDQSSLVALDELIVNREFSKDATKPEETYVFFPVNAAFSPFSGSPNAMYGIAVKKTLKQPAPTSDDEAVQRVLDDLYIGKTSSVRDDLILPTDMPEGVTITWTSGDELVLTIEDPV